METVAHPMRARVLARLIGRRASQSEIARELDTSINLVAYHVKWLERCGLVRVVGRDDRNRRTGPRPILYTAGAVRMSDREWRRIPSPIRNALADAALRELDASLERWRRSPGA